MRLIAGCCDVGRVQQLTGPLGRPVLDRSAVGQAGQLMDSFHRYPVEQNGSDCRLQTIQYTYLTKVFVLRVLLNILLVN